MSGPEDDSLDASMQALVREYEKAIEDVDPSTLTGRDALLWIVPVVATLVNTQLEMITSISPDPATEKRLAQSLALTTGLLDALQELLGRDDA